MALVVIKNPPANEGDVELQVWLLGLEDPLVKSMCQPTSVYLPGESHGQTSPAGELQSTLCGKYSYYLRIIGEESETRRSNKIMCFVACVKLMLSFCPFECGTLARFTIRACLSQRPGSRPSEAQARRQHWGSLTAQWLRLLPTRGCSSGSGVGSILHAEWYSQKKPHFFLKNREDSSISPVSRRMSISPWWESSPSHKTTSCHEGMRMLTLPLGTIKQQTQMTCDLSHSSS